MIPRMALALGALTLTVSSSIVHAAFRCYDDSYFPTALDLRVSVEGVEALLGGLHLDADGRGPLVRFSEKDGWKITGESACSDSRCGAPPNPPDCTSAIPAIPAENGGRRQISACVAHDGVTYFGLDAYRGEGIAERGALGRFDPDSGKVVVRKVAELDDKSVSALLHDGEWLWVGTYRSVECSGGVLPGLALSRYHWERDEWEKVTPTGCGLVIHDLLLEGDAVWVASDMGITRIRPDDPAAHFALLEPDDVPRQMACAALYDHMLATVPTTYGGADLFSPADILLKALDAQQADYLAQRRAPAETLWATMTSGDVAVLRRQLDAGVSPWWRGPDGRSPVANAMRTANLDAMQSLLAARPIDWTEDRSGPNLLREALTAPEILDWLLEQGARGDQLLLLSLIERGETARVKRLLANGLFDGGRGTRSPLSHALSIDAPRALVDLLFDAGMTGPVSRQYAGAHPMMLALNRGYDDLADRLVSLPLAEGQLDWLLRKGHRALFERTARAHAPLGGQANDLFREVIRKDDVETAEFLLAQGIHLPRETQHAVLRRAVARNSEGSIAMLLRHGYGEGIDPVYASRLLPLALRLGLTGFAQHAVSTGARIEAREGRRLLGDSARSGNVEAVRILLRAGVDPDLGEAEGMFTYSRPLDPEVMQKCLRRARGTPECTRAGTPLLAAARSGHKAVVKALADAGADTARRDEVGATLLLAAAASGSVDIIRLARRLGGAWSERDDLGNSALHYAAYNQKREALEFILSEAPDLVRSINVTGATPLHLAAENGAASLVQSLLRYGPSREANMWPGLSVTLTNPRRVPPPTPGLVVVRQPPVARRQGAAGVTVMVSTSGAIWGKKEGPGRTPLDLAVDNGHRDVAALLRMP